MHNQFVTSNHYFIFAKPWKKFNQICCYDFALLERIRQFKVIVFIGKGWVISLEKLQSDSAFFPIQQKNQSK